MKKLLMVSALASSMVLAGCATSTGTGTSSGTGINKAAIGALAGAIGGAAISKATGGEHTERDAAIGAALGAGVGYYMERQAKQLEQEMAGTGVSVQQDPTTGNIDLVMPGNITFAFDDATLNPAFTGTLDKVAQTLIQYNQTTINLAGHTDNVGTDSYNLNLSRQRAAAVANYLVSRGVPANRISTQGYGKAYPIASNATDAGRAQNRRVELTINAPKSIS